MTEEEQIIQVFHKFVHDGLVSRDIDAVLSCVSEQIIGIGIGEQGFVLSKNDVAIVLKNGVREDDFASYSLEYDQQHILIHNETCANACAEVTINRVENGTLTQSKLLQTLIFRKEEGSWKICGLHASVPMATEESMNAYPLKVAEKMLRSLREEIGEKAYLAEEQFQKAILADTIAFYIINISQNRFEKCQTDSHFCVYTEPGTPYEEFLLSNINKYMSSKDEKRFLKKFSLKNIQKAIQNNKKEIKCEYTLKCPDGSSIWVVTVLRLIVDYITGDQKGIMYVKDIDKQKRMEIEMRTKAECDSMTGFYQKAPFVREINRLLFNQSGSFGIFLMLDVDNFKKVNDTFGHPFGDKVLIAVAGILSEQFKENCILGRLGGDEFGIYMAGISSRDLVERAANALMDRFNRIQILRKKKFSISCSIGITSSQNVHTFEELYQQADQALYESKQKGKNCFTFYQAVNTDSDLL